jgi:hypothetical protein
MGKLNVGDNDTVTTLLQSVVSQVVKRLTVALGAPILEAIDIDINYPIARPLLANSTRTRLALSNAESIRLYSSPFVSATGR